MHIYIQSLKTKHKPFVLHPILFFQTLTNLSQVLDHPFDLSGKKDGIMT